MNIGSKLKIAREQQNISMNILAKRADVSQSTLSRIEAGTQMPTFDVLERFISALGYTLADFFSEKAPELPPEVRRVCEKLQKLTHDKLKILESVLDTWVESE